jgi:hypothetical protein
MMKGEILQFLLTSKFDIPCSIFVILFFLATAHFACSPFLI